MYVIRVCEIKVCGEVCVRRTVYGKRLCGKRVCEIRVCGEVYVMKCVINSV